MHVLPLAEAPSPSELACALADAPGLAWLDGDAAHADGRFSFIGIEPSARVEVALSEPDPLAAFERFEPASVPRAASGELDACALHACDVPAWIGYIAYDACLAPVPAADARADRPALAFARYDAVLAFDHVRATAFIVGDHASACERLHVRIAALPRRRPEACVGALSATPAEQHRRAIADVLEHIARGDVYQVNLARCFAAPFAGSPLALFLAMRAASPVPFGFYFTHGARAVLCRTMERFLRWRRAERRLSTRPIKGTIARAGGRDRQEAAELARDEKERAEHAMIVDLMRNDFGRVAEFGSVAVEALLAVEHYAQLSHLVSTVVGRTRPGLRACDVLRATFPPGSVTGAPKLRAVELIERFEQVPRDVYTGAVGFVDREGGLSLAVAIRNALVEGGEVRYFAGGGIVEASRIESEIAETELKARVFFDALDQLSQADRMLDLSGNQVSR